MIYQPQKKTPDGLSLLNLGCGNHYHLAFTNVDFGSRGSEVIGHNLTQGVPFADGVFDGVYHSHVLEHFDLNMGRHFLRECIRVLKPGGTLRIAVPDLEQITRVYLRNLENGLGSDQQAIKQHQWSLLELYDQVTRTIKGGEMAKAADAADPLMRSYIISRHGYEMKERWEPNHATQRTTVKNDPSLVRFIGKQHKRLVKLLVRLVGGSDMAAAFDAGMFRFSGELHLQMYDRLLLKTELEKLGLEQFRVVTATDSSISNWASYQLDQIGDEVRKPDSLFIEARKPLR